MLTLRLDFHIGRVECVTCHLPERKERGGGVKKAEVEEEEDGELVGRRRVIGIEAVREFDEGLGELCIEKTSLSMKHSGAGR